MVPILSLTLSFMVATLALTAFGFAAASQTSWKAALASFLTLNRPVQAEILIVEGWLSDRMLRDAATEFIRGKYSLCLISGNTCTCAVPSPVAVLTRYGVNPAALSITEAEPLRRHRTYHRAIYARQWLQVNHPGVRSLNVFTAGPHGRKSLTLFKRVFGRGFSVGVISAPVKSDNPRLGWKTDDGARNMGRYLIGYLYALTWPFQYRT